jgi:hypothetical protein
MLDADLAELYGVPTKQRSEQVKRNAGRFPEDFMFQLATREFEGLKSQIVTSSLEVTQIEGVVPGWPQFATRSKRYLDIGKHGAWKRTKTQQESRE